MGNFYPGMTELADGLDLGSSVITTWGFKSPYLDQGLLLDLKVGLWEGSPPVSGGLFSLVKIKSLLHGQ